MQASVLKLVQNRDDLGALEALRATHSFKDPDDPLWPRSLPPQQQEALLYGLAKLAIDFVSGPGGIASALRRSLLGAQLNGKSVPLDVG
jgi:hypothetical protein